MPHTGSTHISLYMTFKNQNSMENTNNSSHSIHSADEMSRDHKLEPCDSDQSFMGTRG